MTAPRLTVHAPMDLEAIPEYPLDPDLRLDSHSFIQWEHRRWMSSDMRWNGTHECKSGAECIESLAERIEAIYV